MEKLILFVTIVGPVAASVTKLTDGIRNRFDKGDTAPKWVWNVVPFALGIGAALLGDVDYSEVAPVFGSLDEVAVQVLTGLGIGAVASGWHEVFDLWSSRATEATTP